MATNTELLKEIITNTGGDTNDLPDNLETTLLKEIAENVGGSGSGGGGEEPLVVDFRYKSNGEGYEAYGFTHTNAEIIEAINNDRTVIMKGLINTARDYAPYIFQLHTYMKNSGRYEFVYSTFSNYMEITEYKLNIYTNDDLEFFVNTYKVNQTVPEMPYGEEGQFISFDEEGNLIAVDDAPVYAMAGSSNNDERIEMTTTSLVIKEKFRKAQLTIAHVVPSNYSNTGGKVDIDIYRLEDGSYVATSTCSPVIYPSTANKLTVLNWGVSASVAEQDDGSFKITTSAGGAIVVIDVVNGTVSNSGSGGGSGDFANILVWF